MSFFRDLHETFRDKTREALCRGLQNLRVGASMSERGREEEKIGGGGSLGLIDITEGPIRWVDVREDGEPESLFRPIHYTDYGVPDQQILGSRSVSIESIRVKSSPLFGRVVGVDWKCNNPSYSAVISRLEEDLSLNRAIMEGLDVRIESYPDRTCWILSTYGGHAPSSELWHCLQTIAQHLLSDPTPSGR